MCTPAQAFRRGAAALGQADGDSPTPEQVIKRAAKGDDRAGKWWRLCHLTV